MLFCCFLFAIDLPKAVESRIRQNIFTIVTRANLCNHHLKCFLATTVRGTNSLQLYLLISVMQSSTKHNVVTCFYPQHPNYLQIALKQSHIWNYLNDSVTISPRKFKAVRTVFCALHALMTSFMIKFGVFLFDLQKNTTATGNFALKCCFVLWTVHFKVVESKISGRWFV